MDRLNGRPRARVGQWSSSRQKIGGPDLLTVRPSKGPQTKQDDEVVHWIVLDTSLTGDGSGAKTAARWATFSQARPLTTTFVCSISSGPIYFPVLVSA